MYNNVHVSYLIFFITLRVTSCNVLPISNIAHKIKNIERWKRTLSRKEINGFYSINENLIEIRK